MITVITRSLNEEHRINEFCLAYQNADRILIADGGSTDDTIKLANRFHNVEIREFTEKVQLANGHWRNPDSKHVNFLIEWSKQYKSDWTILDDIDCRPNVFVKAFLEYLVRNPKLSEEFWRLENKKFIMIPRLYLWGLDKHFPRMAQPAGAGIWEPSLYAWRSDVDLWTVDDNFPHYSLRVGDRKIPYPEWDSEQYKLLPPYCLLHYTWDSEERVNKKLQHHREGLGIGMNHPLEMGGPLEILPEWAVE